MLNVYKFDRDSQKLVKYKTAYLKDESGNNIPFKYYLMPSTELNSTEWFPGIETEENTITIRTMTSLKFTVHSKIVIDNQQYSIYYKYSDIPEHTNGIFRKKVKDIQYLVLRK